MISKEKLEELEQLCNKAKAPASGTIEDVAKFFNAQQLLSEVALTDMYQLIETIHQQEDMIDRLQKEADWMAYMLGASSPLPERKCSKCKRRHIFDECPKCWREAARKEVEKNGHKALRFSTT